MYKVVIPSAGVGSRVAQYSAHMNKALISVGPEPVISHVSKFPKNVEIVIPVGYLAEQVIDAVTALFPDRSISFPVIENFRGQVQVSATLLCAKELLQCPFIFCANDTILDGEDIALDPEQTGNWMGFYKKVVGDGLLVESYRTLTVSNAMVSSIHSKGYICDNIYIGVAGIKDYENFWKAMLDEPAVASGEAYGMQSLAAVKAVEYRNWHDCGNLKQLKNAQNKLRDKDLNILEKDNEAIWFKGDEIIKFSTDKSFIADRCARVKFFKYGSIPDLVRQSEHCYVYQKAPGTILSETIDDKITLNLLKFCKENLWTTPSVADEEVVKAACWDFYKKKSYERVRFYLERFEQTDLPKRINSLDVPPALVLLDQVDWSDLCDNPIVGRFHGDFHNENILHVSDNRFIFLDWRQNFGSGNMEIGDVSYDLAKFMHGLIVNHSVVANGQFLVSDTSTNDVRIDIPRPLTLVSAEMVFRQWMRDQGFDERRIDLLTALIFLNICGLHESPYSKFLYLLGRYSLCRALTSSVSGNHDESK